MRGLPAVMVCDRIPQDDSNRDRALFKTEEEQLAAIRDAGFDAQVLLGTSEQRTDRLPTKLCTPKS